MQTNLLWTGREYFSLENCLISMTDIGSEITSTIIGYYEEKIYRVEYQITTNQNWETVLFEINSRHSNQTQSIRFEGDGKGNWKSNGEKAEQFTGCIDIDIPLTPFTNTLPIRRLRLRQQQTQEINVIYCDLLKQQIKPVGSGIRVCQIQNTATRMFPMILKQQFRSTNQALLLITHPYL